MKIRIDKTEQLNAAIKAVEGRATARTITAEGITQILNNISRNIPKTKLHETRVFYDGGEHFPNAYKYRPESTHFQAENMRGKWYITDIRRATCPNRQSAGRIEYSEAAKEYIIQLASRL